MSGKYDHIINLPHHVSKTRPQMPMHNRAAQFSPFAALTGHSAAINETARLTGQRIELGEEAIAELDMKLGMLADALETQPEVTITYFQPDETKAGGAYVTQTGTLKKIDDVQRTLLLASAQLILIDDILQIESSLFPELE